MVYISSIEAALRVIPIEGDKEQRILKEILWVLSIPRLDANIAETLNLFSVALSSLAQVIPIAESLDEQNAALWHNWATTIPSIQDSLLARGAASGRNPKPPKTFLPGLIAPLADGAPSGLLPAKAVWLIGRHLRYEEEEVNFAERFNLFSRDEEDNLANTIRKCCTLRWKHLDLARQYLPDWPGNSAPEWKLDFLKCASSAPRYSSEYWGGADFIRTMASILHAVSNKTTAGVIQCGETSSQQENVPPEGHRHNQEIRTSVITRLPAEHNTFTPRNERPRRLSFTYFRKPIPDADSNSEGLAPKVIHATPQTETPSDQPTSLPVVQSLEVRYSNYRTAMDNQRLPWQWNCLNAFEIKAVRAALTASSKKLEAPLSEKHGAFIVWLLLTTGQTIEEILHFGLGGSQGNRSAIVAGPIYMRSLYAPPHSFAPKSAQQIYLKSHSPAVALALPSPFPTLAVELGLIDSNMALNKGQSTIGYCLNLDIEQAEKAVRLFLENYRTRSFRLLPGRVRNVLSNEIMRTSNDPVATHLLSALPTDTPPSGVYYTSYSQERLERIYAAAMATVFGGGA